MARGINKVILLGHLGHDPSVKLFPDGSAVANLSLATTEAWRDKQSGQTQERTEWHRITIYGKLAEIAGQYLKKGSLIYLEGKMQTRKWQDKSGQDRYTTEVVIDFNGTLQMLDRKPDQQNTPSTPPNQNTKNNYEQAKNGNMPMPSFDDADDDIPF